MLRPFWIRSAKSRPHRTGARIAGDLDAAALLDQVGEVASENLPRAAE
jgi:hypothetical protein